MLFWVEERELIAALVEAYADAIATRVSPALMELPESAVAAAEAAARGAMVGFGDGAGYHGDTDAEWRASEARAGVLQEAAWLALDVHDSVLLAATVGLFHLWEREMRRLLLRGPRFGARVPPRKEVEAASFAGLSRILQDAGWPETMWRDPELERLRLVANVAKHGAGPALRELAARHPDLLLTSAGDMLLNSAGDTPDPELLRVDVPTFRCFAAAVAAFWRSAPAGGDPRFA